VLGFPGEFGVENYSQEFRLRAGSYSVNVLSGVVGLCEDEGVGPSLFTARSTLDTDKGSQSVFRSADLIDTSGATNIAGTKFDSPSNPAAPKGVLDSSIITLERGG